MSLNKARAVVDAQIKRIDSQIEMLSTAKRNLRTSLKMMGRPGSEDRLDKESDAIKALLSTGAKRGRKPNPKNAETASPAPVAKRGRKPGPKAAAPEGKVMAKVTMAKRGKVIDAGNVIARQQAGKLPKTGVEFMTSLVNAVPKSRADLLNAAIEKLAFKPTQTEISKLERRIATAFDVLVKTGKVADQGSGRGRKFLSVAK